VSEPRHQCGLPRTSPAQIDELKDLMAKAHRRQGDRNLDLVLLTIEPTTFCFPG